jgi:uncharacterized protein YutE (UPF0331/DUF86 family)
MTIDREKIRAKLQFLRDALRQLEQIRDRGREAFLSDEILQAAAIRNLQVGIEAMLDMANHIIAREGIAVPGTYRQSMETLLREGILPSSHGESFLRMISFRNRIVHLYDSVDPQEVAGILERHLGDFDLFVGAISRRYFSSSPDPSDPGDPS